MRTRHRAAEASIRIGRGQSSQHGYADQVVVILMGVAGSGKTTIGGVLAKETGWPFIDGDDFHSAAAVAKMRAGVPLTDADRVTWLASPRSSRRTGGRCAGVCGAYGSCT
jgi:adenylylsulfate kinase-like enzyme